MDKHDLMRIKDRFREKTGVELSHTGSAFHRPLRTAILIATICSLFVLTAAATWRLFSPLDGDALTLNATYKGNGIVIIQAQNHSFKKLVFQPHTKLVEWITDQTVPALGKDVHFTGLTVAPRSTGTITVDLSDAYDMDELERTGDNRWYYLLLTNDDFNYGQEWKCSVYFGEEVPKDDQAEEHPIQIDPVILSRIDPALRPYFEDDYYGVFAWNPMHFDYLQTVQELLLRTGKRVVEPVDPLLFIEPIQDGYIIDENYPREKQYQLDLTNFSVRDEFGKLVGHSVDHNVLKQCVILPDHEGATSDHWALPVLFYAVYDLSAIQTPEDCAFIYGQLISFKDLSPHEVYRDDTYVCFDVTHMFYTDLRAYVESVVAMDPDYYYFDEQCWERIVNFCGYFKENLKILSYEEWKQVRPDAKVDGAPEDEALTKTGLDGLITANRDLEGVMISIETIDGTPLHTRTIIPNDPRYFDLHSDRQTSAFLRSLEEGVYKIDVTVFMESEFMSCQSVWGQIFTVGDASWP